MDGLSTCGLNIKMIAFAQRSFPDQNRKDLLAAGKSSILASAYLAGVNRSRVRTTCQFVTHILSCALHVLAGEYYEQTCLSFCGSRLNLRYPALNERIGSLALQLISFGADFPFCGDIRALIVFARTMQSSQTVQFRTYQASN